MIQGCCKELLFFTLGESHLLVSKLPSCMWGLSCVMGRSQPYLRIWRCHRPTFPAYLWAGSGPCGPSDTPTPVLESVACGLEKQELHKICCADASCWQQLQYLVTRGLSVCSASSNSSSPHWWHPLCRFPCLPSVVAEVVPLSVLTWDVASDTGSGAPPPALVLVSSINSLCEPLHSFH